MSETNKWADKDHKWQIIEERKFMWHPSQIERLASAIGLSPGMTVADIGCGLGYLGWTYWKYFGQGGSYTGVDCSSKLVLEATELSQSWSKGGKASFITGDCYSVPLEDNSVDVCMSQTLLGHLQYPARAVKEMVRVTKPGGTVVCKDLDNVSRYMKVNYSSITQDEQIEDILFEKRMRLIYAKGRKNLGFGDTGIGSRIPHLMHEAGLSQIEGFCNERLEFLIPPYEDPEQKKRIEIIQRFNVEITEEDKKEAKEEYRKYYLAGGGNPETFGSDYQRLSSVTAELSRKRSESILSGSLFSCSGGNNFLCVIGRKKRLIRGDA